MSKEIENALDQILMLRMGNDGNTNAHIFLERMARYKPRDAKDAAFKARVNYSGVRVFIPPKEEDRVLFFPDNSGAYAHSDGLCTIMGSDISGEIGQWDEERQ